MLRHKVRFGSIVIDSSIPYGTYRLRAEIHRAADMKLLAFVDSEDFTYIEVPNAPPP